MNRVGIFCLVLAAALPSCKPADPATPVTGNPTSMPASMAALADGKPVLLFVRAKISAIELPAGTVSGSEELWSYLDEERIDAAGAGCLGRNGLRIGTAKETAWPDLAKILKRLTGRNIQQSDGVILPGNPFPVEVKQSEPVQTIFVTHEDRTVSGADYPPGDNMIVLSCTLDQDDLSTVIVSGVPQIRSTDRHAELVHEGGFYSLRNVPFIYSFTPAAFRVSLPNKDILVIGPGPESRRPYSLGNHLLVRKRDGVEYETVLILSLIAAVAPAQK
ncbi:MAG: hypothetical protein ACE15C_02915 [Phycisphaerae bacterium]